MSTEQIRNFCIIAHIDHGKSTLADRFLELTGAVEKRQLKEQTLDDMELERERGITIKMTPVRMIWRPKGGKGGENVLNLIDTPGHVDFSYEVSRALKAVEGAVLLVDATKGVEAQTVSVLETARGLGLKIIPAVNKVDSPLARIAESKEELSRLLDCPLSEILEISGKTGQGVRELLDGIVQRTPPPTIMDEKSATGESQSPARRANVFRALVFDLSYSNHRGVIAYLRLLSGAVKKGDRLILKNAGREFSALQVGVFTPAEEPRESLAAGEIGYVVTGLKEPGLVSVGETVAEAGDARPPLSGYQKPQPLVWSSFYPEAADDFLRLRQALEKLKLSDSALVFEEESSGILGRGFRCGFLGTLHSEIIGERLKREFGLSFNVTAPAVNYRLRLSDGRRLSVYSPAAWPPENSIKEILELWTELSIMTPAERLGGLLPLLHEHEALIEKSENFGRGRLRLKAVMPLRALVRNFFEKLKTVSAGYGSVSYRPADWRPAAVVKLELLLNNEPAPAFARIVPKKTVQAEAEKMAEKLQAVLPRQQFPVKIQAQAIGRILASREVKALRKDVTGYLYGGDITRKMKLRQKQKRGKRKLKTLGRVKVPPEVFVKMM